MKDMPMIKFRRWVAPIILSFTLVLGGGATGQQTSPGSPHITVSKRAEIISPLLLQKRLDNLVKVQIVDLKSGKKSIKFLSKGFLHLLTVSTLFTGDENYRTELLKDIPDGKKKLFLNAFREMNQAMVDGGSDEEGDQETGNSEEDDSVEMSANCGDCGGGMVRLGKSTCALCGDYIVQ